MVSPSVTHPSWTVYHVFQPDVTSSVAISCTTYTHAHPDAKRISEWYPHLSLTHGGLCARYHPHLVHSVAVSCTVHTSYSQISTELQNSKPIPHAPIAKCAPVSARHNVRSVAFLCHMRTILPATHRITEWYPHSSLTHGGEGGAGNVCPLSVAPCTYHAPS